MPNRKRFLPCTFVICLGSYKKFKVIYSLVDESKRLSSCAISGISAVPPFLDKVEPGTSITYCFADGAMSQRVYQQAST